MRWCPYHVRVQMGCPYCDSHRVHQAWTCRVVRQFRNRSPLFLTLTHDPARNRRPPGAQVRRPLHYGARVAETGALLEDRPVGIAAAKRYLTRFLEEAEGLFGPIQAFFAVERGEVGAHSHGLIALQGDPDRTIEAMRSHWGRRNGLSKIERVRDLPDVATYITKHLASDTTDFVVWPPRY